MNSHDVHHMCTMHQVPRAQVFALALLKLQELVTAMPRGLVKKRPAAAMSSIVPVQYEPRALGRLRAAGNNSLGMSRWPEM